MQTRRGSQGPHAQGSQSLHAYAYTLGAAAAAAAAKTPLTAAAAKACLPACMGQHQLQTGPERMHIRNSNWAHHRVKDTAAPHMGLRYKQHMGHMGGRDRGISSDSLNPKALPE